MLYFDTVLYSIVKYRESKNLKSEKKCTFIYSVTPTCIKPLPYCMQYVMCVKCIQKILVFHAGLSFRAGISHGASSVVTGDTVIWHNDNFRWRHWRRNCHRDSSRFSVFEHLFKRLFMFKPNKCRVSSYIVLNTSRGFYSIQKRRPMARL